MSTMNNVLAIILGGGEGTRLHPLTQSCAKPAVTIGGEYRLIDIPISNCLNSGIYRIAVLTQSKPETLHEHLACAYNFHLDDTWVKVFAGAETSQHTGWYRGTADAVRKQLTEIQRTGAEYTLVLAGDHLYRMDYGKMAKFHHAKNADITVAVQPVARDEASRFGILKRAPDGRISKFVEKPTRPAEQHQFICRDEPERPFLGSMGIYMFSSRVLNELLTSHPDHNDFGGDVIPKAIHTHAVYGYVFDGYWQDVGTVRSFYETNLALTATNAPFKFSYPRSPIYTATLTLPPPVIKNAILKNAIISKGCEITGARIEHSVIGARARIANGAVIKDSVIMGADHYQTEGVGENCYVSGAILDKNARLGNGVIIRPFPRNVELDCGSWFVRDGIVIVPKDTEVAAGTVIAPEIIQYADLWIDAKNKVEGALLQPAPRSLVV